MRKNKQNKTNFKKLPRVSICTPTFNRRPFFKGLIDSVLAQKYPKDKIEWIIVDDGTDKIEDLLKDIPFVKYISVEKMTLGRKRNFMHEQCSFKNDDDIIVYMDDDDYYPVERISHSVEKLTGCSALCAGSSEIYIWFNTLNKMYRFGPYGPNHSTAGTFAFKRELLKQTSYEDNALLAEEKHFLKNYTIPFVQLDPLKTILVISHEQNTFDKRRLINPENKQCHESALVPSTFIKNKELLDFYIKEIPPLLENYQAGSVLNKPEVLAEIEKKDRERMIQSQSQGQPQVTIKNPDGTTRVLQTGEIINALKNVTNETLELRKHNEILNNELKRLNEVIINKNIQHYFI
uniref:Glycosyltransferase 2-like domain-containing protein n=1 Tax=viral metagenome TaxID=1070528 RepID=A0A6C0EUJ3_9ZZZZ